MSDELKEWLLNIRLWINTTKWAKFIMLFVISTVIGGLFISLFVDLNIGFVIGTFVTALFLSATDKTLKRWY